MVVRIRVGRGARVQQKKSKTRPLVLLMGAFLTPAALMALVLAGWRIAADLDWAGEFGIANGFFSHWQVWITAAIILQAFSTVLNRYGRSDA
jgi:hypothetical protein